MTDFFFGSGMSSSVAQKPTKTVQLDYEDYTEKGAEKQQAEE